MAVKDLGKVAVTQEEVEAAVRKICGNLYQIKIETEIPEQVDENEIVLVVE